MSTSFLTLVIFAEKRAKTQKELNEIEEQFKLECQEEQIIIKTEEIDENGEKPSEADEQMDTNNNSQNNEETVSTKIISTLEDAEVKDENADQTLEL